jgi:predicted MFS family arabinose efflux permease
MLCLGVLKPYLFGRRYMGGISGIMSAVFVEGFALGPFIYGLAYDTMGGYAGILLGGAVLPAAAALGSLLIRKPAPRIASR